MKFTSPWKFCSKGLPNTINTMCRSITTSSWSQNPHYRWGYQTITASKGLTQDLTDFSQASAQGKILLPCVERWFKGKFYIHTLPVPERSPVLWGTTPADSKGVAVHLSLAEEFCTWPLSRLYIITPERPGLLHATTSSSCICLGIAKQAQYALCYLPTRYVATSPSGLAAYFDFTPALPSESYIQAGCVQMSSSPLTEGTPATEWEGARAAHPCSRDGLITKVSEPVKNRIHRSLKYQKSAIHFVSVIKSLRPEVSWKAFNEIFIFTMIFSLSLSLHRDTNCAIEMKSGTNQPDVS